LARNLLASALTIITHHRQTSSEAGKAVLCILYDKLVQRSDHVEETVTFVEELIDRLEIHVAASERNLARGIMEKPLHGLISALQLVISQIAVKALIERQGCHRLYKTLGAHDGGLAIHLSPCV
jgi:hypothetical protein